MQIAQIRLMWLMIISYCIEMEREERRYHTIPYLPRGVWDDFVDIAAMADSIVSLLVGHHGHPLALVRQLIVAD